LAKIIYLSGDCNRVENGKTIILETQDATGMMLADTVKVENGKFEMKEKLLNLHFIVYN
jgi:hypothetical protein